MAAPALEVGTRRALDFYVVQNNQSAAALHLSGGHAGRNAQDELGATAVTPKGRSRCMRGKNTEGTNMQDLCFEESIHLIQCLA